MSTRCLHGLPVVSLLAITLFTSALARGQGRGGGSPRGGATTSTMVNPTANRNGYIGTGTGNDINPSVVRLNSASDEAKVEFRSQTVLIQIPVVVTDKSGNHLHGLSKEDFTIFENGKPVSVANFEELTAGTGRLAPPPVAAGQFRSVSSQSGGIDLKKVGELSRNLDLAHSAQETAD